jgi:hypothetical protein
MTKAHSTKRVLRARIPRRAQPRTQTQKHDRLGGGQIVQRIQQNLQMLGEVVFKHLQPLLEPSEPGRIVGDGTTTTTTTLRLGLGLGSTGGDDGGAAREVGVGGLDVASKGAGELGVLAACRQDSGVDLVERGRTFWLEARD